MREKINNISNEDSIPFDRIEGLGIKCTGIRRRGMHVSIVIFMKVPPFRNELVHKFFLRSCRRNAYCPFHSTAAANFKERSSILSTFNLSDVPLEGRKKKSINKCLLLKFAIVLGTSGTTSTHSW